jgi:phosphohistidine phosphatase
MIIGEYRDKPGSLMLIGHNPGLDELTTYLADEDVPYTDNGKLMTTGCLAHFSIPEDEPKLQANCKLLSITRPSELRRLT